MNLALRQAFPDKMDMVKINTCKQNKDESVDDFIHCLMTTFEANSGMVKPPNTDGVEADPYESHLCGHIFKGLRQDVAAEVKRSYVGGEDEPRLVELRRHAHHAQKFGRKENSKGREGNY